MRIIHTEAEFTGRASVVALGMFDGVHIGHQALIRQAVALARELAAESVVCTFDRHPLAVVKPEFAPKPLLTLEENLEKFARLGADWALVKAFTRAFAATPPEEFIERLVMEMRVKAIVVGENYSFGAGGRGGPGMIRDMAAKLDYRAVIVPPVLDGEVMCSSTRIRGLLAKGETEHARRLMALEDDA